MTFLGFVCGAVGTQWLILGTIEDHFLLLTVPGSLLTWFGLAILLGRKF